MFCCGDLGVVVWWVYFGEGYVGCVVCEVVDVCCCDVGLDD